MDRSVAGMRVDALDEASLGRALQLAEQLGLPQADLAASLALQVGVEGLQLQLLGKGAPGPVRVDFVAGAAAHRRQFGGGLGQMIAKAVGLQPGIRPQVLDATAGLGGDAFVLASLGCSLWLLERNPVVAALLEDGLQRALLDAEIGEIARRMQLVPGDALAEMPRWPADRPQVIYLDPMFPERRKSAAVKKDMRLFHDLVGADDDSAGLLAAALALATHRVVVKRPRKASALAGQAPGYSLEGKSSRYDIYPLQALKK